MDVDSSLPVMNHVKVLVGKSSVGFEWPAIKDTRIKGFYVYRAEATPGTTDQKFYRIATVSDPYATHYVDKDITPNQRYYYMFTTYDLTHESPRGTVLKVHASSPFRAVDFIKVYSRGSGVVKVLWKPHSDPGIVGYILQRRLEGGADKAWHYLAKIQGRLVPEYIDASGVKGSKYSYRVLAQSSTGILSVPSRAATLTVR